MQNGHTMNFLQILIYTLRGTNLVPFLKALWRINFILWLYTWEMGEFYRSRFLSKPLVHSLYCQVNLRLVRINKHEWVLICSELNNFFQNSWFSLHSQINLKMRGIRILTRGFKLFQSLKFLLNRRFSLLHQVHTTCIRIHKWDFKSFRILWFLLKSMILTPLSS